MTKQPTRDEVGAALVMLYRKMEGIMQVVKPIVDAEAKKFKVPKNKH